MLTFRESLGHNRTAARADLGRTVGVDPANQRTSFLGFVRQHKQELRPTGVSHTLAHVAAAEALDVQVFDSDETVLLHEPSRELVLEIPPLVGNVLVQPSDLAAQLSISTTAPFAASTLALEQGQFLFGLAKPTGVLDHLASGEGSEVSQAHIDPHSRTYLQFDVEVGQLDLENDVPVAQPVTLEDRHLDLASVGDRAMLKEPDETHVLDIESALFEPDPIVVDVADRLEPSSALEAWIAGFLPLFDAPEEGFKSLVETTKGLLERGVVAPGNVGVEGTDRFELIGLVGVADAHAAAFPGVSSFLKSGVVDLAVGLQDAVARQALSFIGVKSELETEQHIKILAQMFDEVKLIATRKERRHSPPR